MQPQEVLDQFQALILLLRDRNKEFSSNPELVREFISRKNYVQAAYESLSQDDKNRIDVEYKKWFDKEIKPAIIDPEKSFKDYKDLREYGTIQ